MDFFMGLVLGSSFTLNLGVVLFLLKRAKPVRLGRDDEFSDVDLGFLEEENDNDMLDKLTSGKKQKS